MVKQLVIVGGGTAGWLTAAYLARTLATAAPGGVRITLVESADIGILGVGEGTFPSIQRTLRRIGMDEGTFLRESNATFKQGIRFVNWRLNPGSAGRNDYFHPFQSAQVRQGGLDLLPYWLLGLTPGLQLDEAATIQKRVADAARAPKRISDADFDAPLSYAYHFDAVSFARTLRVVAKQLGVEHVTDTVEVVNLDATGAIESLSTREHGRLKGDLYVDCSGFRAQLIGRTLGIPFKSCQSTLFCDRAVAMQVPYERPDTPIASYTISTAHEAGWTWDIGLDTRRGVGYVYSSAHSDDERAERVLRDYIGSAADGRTVRAFKFEAGYRETSWHANCVAIGLAGGFFEPLEATGIVFIEVAAILALINKPWTRRELLCALSASDDQEKTADTRAALVETGDEEAQKAVLAWEERNPHENEAGSYLEIGGRRLGPFYTFGELALKNCAARIRYEMDKLHDRVMKLRDVIPPEPPESRPWWRIWGS